MGFIKLVKKDKKQEQTKTSLQTTKEMRGAEKPKLRPVTNATNKATKPAISKQEEVVRYVITNKATTRSAGEHFGISHMTVQRYVQKMADDKATRDLFTEARKVLNGNASESTLRGGQKTSDLYKGKPQLKPQ